MTARQSSYRRLRAGTRRIIAGQEGLDVEFKQSLAAVESQDLVAFANADGGIILVGVAEDSGTHGQQQGRIVGCTVGDRERNSIVSRANACHPPVQLNITVENTNARPILRIDIPAGSRKPHCTSGGSYKIRRDGQKAPLLPEELEMLILRREEETFLLRFAGAAEAIRAEMQRVERTLSEAIQSAESTAEAALAAAQDASHAAEQAAAAAEDAVAAAESLGP